MATKRYARDEWTNEQYEQEADNRYSKRPRVELELEEENERLRASLMKSSEALAEVHEETQECQRQLQLARAERVDTKKQVEFLCSEIVAVTRIADDAKSQVVTTGRLLEQARAEMEEEHEHVLQLKSRVQQVEKAKAEADLKAHGLEIRVRELELKLKSKTKIKLAEEDDSENPPQEVLALGLATWESDPVALLTKRFILVGANHAADETDEEKKLNPFWIAKLDLALGVQLGQRKGAILAGTWAVRKTSQSLYKIKSGESIEDSNLGFDHILAALDRLPDSLEACEALREYVVVHCL